MVVVILMVLKTDNVDGGGASDWWCSARDGNKIETVRIKC